MSVEHGLLQANKMRKYIGGLAVTLIDNDLRIEKTELLYIPAP